MDDVPHCDWAAPAVVRRGDLVLAVGTGGASPAIARRVRERLEAEYGEEWAELLRVVADVRDEVRMQVSDPRERAARWRRVYIPGPEVLAMGAEELRDRLLRELGVPEPWPGTPALAERSERGVDRP
jgi:siroheme synthase-like protein